MLKNTRNWLLAGLVGLLVACSGGGGGNSAPGVEPGPTPPGGTVPPPPPNPPAPFAPYADAQELRATITSVTLDEDERAIVDFQLTDGNGTAIVDLGPRDVRFTIAKLQASPLGNLTGTWQSYQNQIETPEADEGIGTEQRLQATYERDAAGGEFTNNGDGTYRYHFELSLTNLEAAEDGEEILAQAALEGLNLDFEPDRTHRVSMQFDGSEGWANPSYDWVPSGAALSSMDIAATANCNRCHDPLGIHGSGVGPRREVEYCVTCHNAGTTDADSTNTLDMKVMIHKIHMGKNLPSVQAGGEYVIYGFNDSPHNYSDLAYPQDIRNCINCHVGTGTPEEERIGLTVTSQGDNWAEVPTAAACGSCHDDELGPDDHIGSKANDSGCASCHSESGPAGSVQYSHRIELAEARKTLKATVTQVDNSMRGEKPVVTFKITNPLDGNQPYDIHNDPIFTNEDTRLAVGIAWDTTDYNNIGNNGDNASQVQEQDMSKAMPNGDGSYSIVMPEPIPDGTVPPGRPASGSGVATVEGHPVFELDTNNDGSTGPTEVPVGDATTFFSIDEPEGVPEKRRVSVDIAQCNTCHSTLILHGNNRADNIDSCVSCHNPRNTDKRRRLQATDPPTDGKDEESIDFKTMVHGIHAAAIRENALEIVGFGGFTTHRYTTEEVHYPGNLANCATCHTEEGFMLPLADGVLGTTIDTGPSRTDPNDDTVVTPISAVCSSCHDDIEAKNHMTLQGGNFATTQGAIDSGDVAETCNTCHAADRTFDAWKLHQQFLE